MEGKPQEKLFLLFWHFVTSVNIQPLQCTRHSRNCANNSKQFSLSLISLGCGKTCLNADGKEFKKTVENTLRHNIIDDGGEIKYQDQGGGLHSGRRKSYF